MKNGDYTTYQYHGLTSSDSQEEVSRLESPSCLKQPKQTKYETREWTSGTKGSGFCQLYHNKAEKKK